MSERSTREWIERTTKMTERARCAAIARLAAQHARYPEAKNAAEAIATAIENDAL